MPDLDHTLALILAGGAGSRLYPLTEERAKPAVPFGGKYRIIDFALSNCLHSGIRRVLVVTQYKSQSLQKHLRDGWSIYNPELGEYITPVPPQMRRGGGWYTGTADAVFQNLYLLERSTDNEILILSGDHIYRMDYAEMIRLHREHKAPVTIACMEVPTEEAHGFGIVTVDEKERVLTFKEKPEDAAAREASCGRCLASMGIYVFDKAELITRLQADHTQADSIHDFGHDILPGLLSNSEVYAYRFGVHAGRVSSDRYWRDVGTLDAYFEASMALLDPVPPLDLYQQDWVIRTYQGQNPPARTVPGESAHEGVFVNSILAGGVVICGGRVDHSILFPRVRVDDQAIVQNSILFDGVYVGAGAELRHCIVDKRVAIPPQERIGLDAEKDRKRFTISSKGIVVVPEGYRF